MDDDDGGWRWRMVMEDGNGRWQNILHSTLVCKQGRPLTVVVDLWWLECTNLAPMLCTKTTRSSCLLLPLQGMALWLMLTLWDLSQRVANFICSTLASQRSQWQLILLKWTHKVGCWTLENHFKQVKLKLKLCKSSQRMKWPPSQLACWQPSGRMPVVVAAAGCYCFTPSPLECTMDPLTNPLELLKQLPDEATQVQCERKGESTEASRFFHWVHSYTLCRHSLWDCPEKSQCLWFMLLPWVLLILWCLCSPMLAAGCPSSHPNNTCNSHGWAVTCNASRYGASWLHCQTGGVRNEVAFRIQ